MQHSSEYIADLTDIAELEEIEEEVTRLYRPRASQRPAPLSRRRARARARLGMVSGLIGLVLLGLLIDPPTIPSRAAASFPTRATVPAELLGSDPIVTQLRRASLPSRSTRPTALGLDRDLRGLPLKTVPFGGISVGEPHRGQLFGGVRLPENRSLYIVRRPEFAYGSTHAVTHLQIALAKFRRHSKYKGPLVVSDLSAAQGGRHWPHISHQSGRDVDLWLPLRCDNKGVTLKGGDPQATQIDFVHFSAARPQEVDWDASWQLVKALVRTGQVDGIFLARPKHRFLRQAAMRNGLSAKDADDVIQGEQPTLDAMVRHVRGHDKHLHVRFRCADYEARCR
jgi:murein endopeptidase